MGIGYRSFIRRSSTDGSVAGAASSEFGGIEHWVPESLVGTNTVKG
jgi:hypothetical protein